VGVKLTSGVKFRLKIFEKRALREIFLTRKETAGGYRKLHREGLYDFYSSPHDECYSLTGHMACIRKKRDQYRF